MNALANGAYTQPGAAIDNTSGLYPLGDLVIVLSSAVTPTISPLVGIWILPSPDGTNYPTPPGTAAAAAPANLYAGTMTLVASVSTSVMVVRGLVLPPSLFKVMIQNQLGVALPSSTTSTCKLYRYSEQVV
jgi:hypothetical protein